MLIGAKIKYSQKTEAVLTNLKKLLLVEMSLSMGCDILPLSWVHQRKKFRSRNGSIGGSSSGAVAEVAAAWSEAAAKLSQLLCRVIVMAMFSVTDRQDDVRSSIYIDFEQKKTSRCG